MPLELSANLRSVEEGQRMDNANLSEKPTLVSLSAIDDVPEALRDEIEPQPQPQWQKIAILLVSIGLGTIISGGILWFTTHSLSSSDASLANNSPPPSSPLPSTPPSTPSEVGANSNPSVLPSPTLPTPSAVSPTPGLPNTASVQPPASPTPDTVLGHFPYPEAPLPDLAPIVPDGSIKLRKAAAQKFLQMVEAARQEGVILVPISGFRSIKDQEYLFFEVKAERAQDARKRAEVSAPPGYSEHHTGYAVDIGDGNVPATNLSQSFEQTAAFQWLKANAARYSFEISFMPNNPQGVTYEPWHWRYVGDIQSLETFFKARNRKSSN